MIIINGNIHLNNNNCKSCWIGYPIECDCGGLIHMDAQNKAIIMCDECNIYEELIFKILNE